MEVLMKGRMPEYSRWYGKCSNCGAILMCYGHEFSEIKRGDYRSDGEDWAYMPCPECKVDTVCFHKEGTKSGDHIKDSVPF